MTDHCTACAIVPDLTEHRDDTYGWGRERALLNFACWVAERHCPRYRTAHEAHTAPEEDR